MDALKLVELKMRQAGLGCTVIRAFRQNYLALVSGETGLIPEGSIQPVENLPRLEEFRREISNERASELVSQTVVFKLNGGLGTSMGLDKAKSLIEVKNGLNFLDFTARQILHLREKFHAPLRFLVLNSFNTSVDTLRHLQTYPDLGGGDLPLQLIQSKAPKLCADTLLPVEWPEQPELEWCPPGHGDLYPTLAACGLMEKFSRLGIRYLFISNSDNLGANLDLGLLDYFATSEIPFLMEVAERTASDKKGGHLARNAEDGRLLLRESAQCRDEDGAVFQDITRHRFFNTNNLWVRVDRLEQELKANGDVLPLPLIRNIKTVDPRNKKSPQVVQLETAMGAAIQLFEGAGAVVVPRRRFAPVKTTSDLLALRSDAYRINKDFTLELAPERNGVPPAIRLEDGHYKMMDSFELAFGDAVPSLKACQSLEIKGPVRCAGGVRVEGKVKILNSAPERKEWKAGVYRDAEVGL
ncbi:MAG: UTP--glucose-1-phosphate uridylyltransferase [Methylacidiphilales bacterium]|nr:UTP--glucose-1-phosphate uridylyltransferase [Candidatus Methylacidiphilales bacterium]